MALGEYPKIEPVLLPFLNRPEPPKYELLFIMGRAYQNREEFKKAIEVFDKTISHYGLNIYLLNSIGECHFRLGETDEALAAWQKSLELNPDQPQLKKIVEALKEKK
jgi:tetratricopeptide (TPR) repeat protein